MNLIGTSLAMAELRIRIEKAALCDKTVLILGETGTGKDLAARKIHEMSTRSSSPFLALNCSALPESLFESELFGHTRGAFTGAVAEKEGLLEAAGRGTLFMDEIGELSSALQAKLLRLLDKREARPVGSTSNRTVKSRFIFATNRNLFQEVQAGKFRKDLYYRINVICIEMPALRERKEDIPELAAHFVARENVRNNCIKHLSPGALRKLSNHNFPGNVRELENLVERAYVAADRDTIEAADIKFYPGVENKVPGPGVREIRQVLDRCRWSKTAAAKELGISRRQLYRLLEKLDPGD